MKRLLILITGFFMSALLLQGQTTKTITLTFDADDFSYVYDSGNYLSIECDSTDYIYDETMSPYYLPSIEVSVLLGPQQEIISHTFYYNEEIIINNVQLAQLTIPVPMGVNALPLAHVGNATTIWSSGNDGVRYNDIDICDGYRIASFSINPFRFDETTHNVSFRDTVIINLSLTNTLLPYPSNNQGHNMHDFVMSTVINGDELDSLYQISSHQMPPLYPGLNPGNSFDYVIITDTTLVDAFRPLARWKTQKGVRTRIATTQYIYNNYTGTSNPLKIKKFLKDCYSLYGIKYALLGGDNSIIPVQTCYSDIYFNDTLRVHEPAMPTDWFYACLDDPIDWDRNHNDTIGDIKDTIDCVADIFLTRLPVRTVEHINSYTKKLLSYEQHPPIDEWQNSILLCANKIEKDSINNDTIMSDAHISSEIFRKDFIQNRWNGNTIRFYDTHTDFAGGPNYDYTSANMQEQFARGYTFIDIHSHGNSAEWDTETGYGYEFDKALTLQNKYPTIITSSACFVNAFDNYFDPCLSEAFIRGEDNNVIAFIGNSRNGYSTVFSLGYSHVTMSYFYKYLFNKYNENNFGIIMAKVRKGTGKYKDYSYWRYLYLGLNPVGDAEMPIFIEKPKLFSDIQISVNNNVCSITNNENCTACIMDIETWGENYYSVKDNINNYTFTSVPDSFSICITKQGYVPCTYIHKNGVTYLQDDFMRGDYNISSDKIVIGKDVTDKEQQGVIVIDQGHLGINGSKEVIIKNNFKVEYGATLNIHTGQ